MTGTEIITRFNLQIDDSSELSDGEALDLANEVYEDICNDRPWEWLRATATGTMSLSVPYIALPSDFKKVMPNDMNEAVVFVGTLRTPYRVVSYANRHEYRDQYGYCYIDVPNARLVFTKQPTVADAIEYDYVKVQTALTTGTSPLFREGFHKIIPYGMAAAFNPIEHTDKAESYQRENQQKYNDLLSDMANEDAEIKVAYA